ncbi:MAG TPA: DUF3368 domain-containing protein [Candidatus Nanoarchaeia archaeon]|nr:DUF3368 domain-containing protein [Candidatus Nanoarchaeia archaeon]
MKPIFIFDATPLIYFTKTRVLEKIEKFKSQNIIPGKVYEEVVEKNTSLADSGYIRQLVKKKLFEIRQISLRSLPNSQLSLADLEVIALAKELKGIALIDDKYAKQCAELEKVEVHGSLYLLFLFLEEKLIPLEEAQQVVDAMIENGWYCSPDLYATIHQKLKKY